MLFTEEGSFVENTDPPTGDCRDYVILRMPSHFKSASYNPNAGKKPLNFSKPWTLTKEAMVARLRYLQKKQRFEALTPRESAEMSHIEMKMKRKSASYQFKHRKWGLKGAEPLDFSNPETLKDVQLTRRIDFLRKKGIRARGAYQEPLSRSEKEEMRKIKREITKRRSKA